MTCERFRTEIEEAAATAALGATAEAHLAACGGCRDFRDGRASLRGLVRDLPRVDAPPDFEFRLRARMAAEQPFAPGRAAFFGGRASAFGSLLPRAAWLTAACSLALVAGLALLTRTPTEPKLADNAPAIRAQDSGATQGASTASGASQASREQAANGAQAAVGRENDAQAVASGPQFGAASDPVEADVAKSARTDAVERVSTQARRARVQHRQRREEIASRAEARGETEAASLHSFGGNEIRAIPLPVPAQDGPMEVLFKDISGASRTVRVDPVGFGSRELAGPGLKAVNASFDKSAAKQGVW